MPFFEGSRSGKTVRSLCLGDYMFLKTALLSEDGGRRSIKSILGHVSYFEIC